MIWLVFIPVIIILFQIGEHGNRILSNISKVCLVLLLAYIVAFGGSLAADYKNYTINYQRYTTFSSVLDFVDVLNFDKSSTIEYDNYGPLFKLACYLCYKIGLSGTGFIFVLSIITNSFFIKTIYQFKRTAISGFLFIVCYGGLLLEANLVRQALCISIFLFSLKYLVDKKAIKFLCFIVVASLIHYSSILLVIFTPFLFYNIEKYSKYVNRVVVILTCLSFFVGLGLFSLGNIWNIPVISLLLGDTIYSGYMTNENTVGATLTVNYLYNLTVLALLFYKKEKDAIYTLILGLGCILANISMDIPNLYRFSLFFTGLYPILFSSIFNVKNYMKPIRGYINICGNIILIFYVFFSYFYVMVINDSSVIGKVFLPLSSMFN